MKLTYIKLTSRDVIGWVSECIKFDQLWITETGEEEEGGEGGCVIAWKRYCQATMSEPFLFVSTSLWMFSVEARMHVLICHDLFLIKNSWMDVKLRENRKNPKHSIELIEWDRARCILCVIHCLLSFSLFFVYIQISSIPSFLSLALSYKAHFLWSCPLSLFIISSILD